MGGMTTEQPGAASVSKAKPVALSDLKARLELLTKHGVRSYRDGILSIDIDTTKKPAGKSPRDEFPPIPEM